MKKFLIRIACYVTIIATVILAVNTLYFYIDPEYNSMNVHENVQICNFGSSHGQCSFNYKDFKAKYVCSNFGMNSQSLLYDYRILQNYQNKLQPEAKVFIVVSYFSFFGSPEAEGKDFLSRNKRYYKFLPREAILQYDWNIDMYMNYLPCLSIKGLSVFIKHILGLDRKAKIYKLCGYIFRGEKYDHKAECSISSPPDIKAVFAEKFYSVNPERYILIQSRPSPAGTYSRTRTLHH